MPIQFDTTLMRVVKDLNEIKAALRHVTSNLPLFDIANENTPTALSTDQNDYVPGNYDVLRLNATADITITGFANGKKGRFLEIVNVGTGRISFPDESSSSIAINRIATPYDQTIVVLPNARVRFYYDSTSARWTVSDLPNIQGQFGRYSIISHSTLIIQTVTTASLQVVLEPDTIVSDEWGYWDAVNFRFTVPTGESGLYSIVANYTWGNNDTTDYLGNTVVYKNTSVVGQTLLKCFGADNNRWPTLAISYVFLDAGDYVQIKVQNVNGSALDREARLVATGAPVLVFTKL